MVVLRWSQSLEKTRLLRLSLGRWRKVRISRNTMIAPGEGVSGDYLIWEDGGGGVTVGGDY